MPLLYISSTKDKWDQKYASTSISKTLLELAIYILFLINATFLAYQLAGPTFYYFTRAMRDVFIDREYHSDNDMDMDFYSTAVREDFWAYNQKILIPGLYPGQIDEAPAKLADSDSDGNKERKAGPSGSDIYILTENLLLSVPRFRQLRVRDDSCFIHKLFQRQFKECYGPFTKKNEDRADLVKGDRTWTWNAPNSDEEFFSWGELQTYPGGGFIQEIPTDRKAAEALVNELKEKEWMDRGTRIVFTEFTIYNGNANIFCIVKLMAETSTAGGVIPSFSMRTVKLLRFITAWDYFIVVCEAIFLLQVIWYTIEEGMEMYQERFSYFGSFWNWIDLTILVLSYTTLILSLLRYIFINSKLKKYASLSTTQHEYISFGAIGYWQLLYNNMMGICVFLIWVKILKYISFNRTMLQFSTTLKRCAKDLLGFAVMFLIVFIAFAEFGFMLFGTENPDFQSFTVAMFTLMRTILGDFDYMALQRTNRILGPIYFILFIFFVFFILLNMFLAIINDCYSEVKAEPAESAMGEIKNWLINKWNFVFGRCFNKKFAIKPKEVSEEEEVVAGHRRNANSNTALENKKSETMMAEYKNSVDNRIVKIESRIRVVEQTIDGIMGRMDRLILRLEQSKTRSV